MVIKEIDDDDPVEIDEEEEEEYEIIDKENKPLEKEVKIEKQVD